MGEVMITRAEPSCPTCGGDGTMEKQPFDGNCPAAWAHRFVRPLPTGEHVPSLSMAESGGAS